MEKSLFAEALAKAQSKIISASKDAKNPVYNSRYATLASVWDAVREPFTENNISVIQTVDSEGEHYYVTTTLAHSSGESKSCRMKLILLPRVTKDGRTLPVDMQSLGSAITYARRYQLSAMGCVPQDDDDANEASNKAINPMPPIKPIIKNHAPQKQPESENQNHPDEYFEVDPNWTPLQKLQALAKHFQLSNKEVTEEIVRLVGRPNSKECSDSEINMVFESLKKRCQ